MMKVYMDFPREEHPGLMRRLELGKHCYTTRILNERGKYFVGQVVQSPLGNLIVNDVQIIHEVREHPFVSELTKTQRTLLKNKVMDLVSFRRADAKSVQIHRRLR